MLNKDKIILLEKELQKRQEKVLSILAKELDINQHDLYFKLGAELEFYIKNNQQLSLHSEEIQNIMEILETKYSDLKLESLEEEDGFNQFEVQFKTTQNAVELSKQINTFRSIMQKISNVDFRAKPYVNDAGSSLHFHISIYYNNVNLFSKDNPRDNEEYYYLPLYWSIAGMLKNMLSAMRLFAPTENCYERYLYPKNQKFIHNPTGVCWGFNNRTCAIRIPKKPTEDPDNCRIEYRICSSISDPYLDLIAIFYSMQDGILNKLECPEPIFGNAFDVLHDYLTPLPKSLSEANILFKNGVFYKLKDFLS